MRGFRMPGAHFRHGESLPQVRGQSLYVDQKVFYRWVKLQEGYLHPQASNRFRETRFL